MSFELTDDDGKFLVKLVRDTVETFLKTGRMLKVSKDVPQKFYRKCGVFVTINMFDKGEKVLRGCIGYPYPTSSLVEAVVDLSINAATEDSTFSIYDF
ncbi:MAG: AMMECR1 domain-containing protein [Nitrososphaerota archaeon]|nr:AMMECR1 domain-containing protein [Nitrososphaerota archaeon]